MRMEAGNLSRRKAYITNLATENTEPLEINVEGTVYGMVWSPDGSKIALSVAPTSSVDLI